jgi:hypothetical protein
MPMQIAESATLKAGQWLRADVDVEEVDDVAEAEAVEEVADRAAEDEVQAGLEEAVGDGGAQRVHDHHEEDGDGAEVEQQRDERDDALAPMPNAAPVLRTCTSWKKFGMMGMVSCRSMRASTSAWSRCRGR